MDVVRKWNVVPWAIEVNSRTEFKEKKVFDNDAVGDGRVK